MYSKSRRGQHAVYAAVIGLARIVLGDVRFLLRLSHVAHGVKDIVNSEYLSNEDSAYCPSYIKLCTKLPLK